MNLPKNDESPGKHRKTMPSRAPPHSGLLGSASGACCQQTLRYFNIGGRTVGAARIESATRLNPSPGKQPARLAEPVVKDPGTLNRPFCDLYVNKIHASLRNVRIVYKVLYCIELKIKSSPAFPPNFVTSA